LFNAYPSVSGPDPHGSALKWLPGSGSALEILIPDPDPAAIKWQKKMINV